MLEDCIGWTTEVKKGALRTSANAVPTDLAKDEIVEVVQAGLETEPRSLVVQTAAGTKLEIRERLLSAPL